jgi:hypothetical protein
VRAFRLPSSPLSSPTLYSRDGSGACVPYTGDVSTVAFYRRSDCVEVQPSEFVPVKLSLQK